MRKRWVWIGVAATALILAVFALLLPGYSADKFDFLDNRKPSEVSVRRGGGGFDVDACEVRIYRFRGNVEALRAKAKLELGSLGFTLARPPKGVDDQDEWRSSTVIVLVGTGFEQGTIDVHCYSPLPLGFPTKARLFVAELRRSLKGEK